MTGGSPNQEGSVLFHCPTCAGTLSVPQHLAGIAGPCPYCQQMVRSPAVSTGVQGRPVQQFYQEPQRQAMSASAVPAETKGYGPISARKGMRSIRQNWRLDERWKERHRDLARRLRNKRKWQEAVAALARREVGVVVVVIFVCLMGLIALRAYEKRHTGDGPEVEEAHFGLPEARVDGSVPVPSVNWRPEDGFRAEGKKGSGGK